MVYMQQQHLISTDRAMSCAMAMCGEAAGREYVAAEQAPAAAAIADVQAAPKEHERKYLLLEERSLLVWPNARQVNVTNDTEFKYETNKIDCHG